MSSFLDGGGRRRVVRALVSTALVALCAAGLSAAAQPSTGLSSRTTYTGIGRSATPQEVAAWDIDVRPDFKGLPKGAGSVAQGMDLWEAKCASCHGVFGESNQSFAPLVGGTTADDSKTGHVARLNDPAFPGRTTLMKLSSLSTLWDYIHRAMPWNAPKSLSADEVYAVTAYLLNLGRIVPDDFTLSDSNIAATQQLLPNRNGMSTAHALWPGKSLAQQAARPDVQATACMHNCATEPKVASLLPAFARNAHGNLAEQNRLVGAQRGADTTRPAAAAVQAAGALVLAQAAQAATPSTTATASPAPAATPSTNASAAPAPGGPRPASAMALVNKFSCTGCHGLSNKIVGPAFQEIGRKYSGRADAAAYLAGKIRAGSNGVWGPIAMPAQPLNDADAQAIAQWLATGAAK